MFVFRRVKSIFWEGVASAGPLHQTTGRVRLKENARFEGAGAGTPQSRGNDGAAPGVRKYPQADFLEVPRG